MGFTPFFLAYGAEAVLPSDLDHGTPRVKAFDRDRAMEAQQDAIDLLEEVVKFFLDIIYRLGVPNCIITDHGTNFTGKKFLDFSNGYGIRIDWASVGHPRTNGQVERPNGMVLQGL